MQTVACINETVYSNSLMASTIINNELYVQLSRWEQ